MAIQHPGVISAARSSTELYWKGGVSESSFNFDMELSRMSLALSSLSPEASKGVLTIVYDNLYCLRLLSTTF